MSLKSYLFNNRVEKESYAVARKKILALTVKYER